MRLLDVRRTCCGALPSAVFLASHIAVTSSRFHSRPTVLYCLTVIDLVPESEFCYVTETFFCRTLLYKVQTAARRYTGCPRRDDSESSERFFSGITVVFKQSTPLHNSA